MEPTETWCDLASRWAEEDDSEVRSRRFAAKLDKLALTLGLPRHRVAAWLAHAGDFAAFPVVRVA